MGGETHVFSPAYRDDEFDEIARLCDHIVFNSPSQLEKFRERAKGKQVGLRLNPEYSEIKTEMYNPCARFSRLGVTRANFDERVLEKIDGLHFHTMCEQGAGALQRTLAVVEEKFGAYLKRVKWLNFGGGHHITRDGYDINALTGCILRMKEDYGLEIYLEPGEAVALNAGFLVASVLDTLQNGMNLAILDASAACHMPDVLEAPYRPQIIGAGLPEEKPHTCRLGGPTCLAGDRIGDYSFEKPLKTGDKLIFCDMAIYSMVKNNTFNGMNLPSIAVLRENGAAEIVKTFGYGDFKGRVS
jgi:carboxynorspermidine decarboxylase